MGGSERVFSGAIFDQLFFDLVADASASPSVHFCDKADLDAITLRLAEHGVAVVTIEGARLHSLEDIYKAFSVAFRKPKEWYGEEEYAPNADAFLEYLDDVSEWIPSSGGHVAVITDARNLWREQPNIAGLLVEWWQVATVRRGAKIHLVFTW